MHLLYLYINHNTISIIHKQYSISLVIAVLYIITAWRDNYILLFKNLSLATQAQAPLRVIICYLIIDISPNIKQLTSDKWLKIKILKD